MAPRILVVDRNEAFATMLRQMLETDGGYEVGVARSGSAALALLRQSGFDLTIVDMDLDVEDMGYRDLILNVRRLEPTMRLVLIPLMGEDLPPEVHQLGVQAALSKPFFADDLLPKIEQALAEQVSPSAPEMAVPPSSSRSTPGTVPDLQAALAELSRETSADAVLLLSMISSDQRIIAQMSTLDEAKLEALADLGIGAVRAAQATARLLGQNDKPFAHNMFESDTHRLYLMTVPENRLVMVVTPSSIPLGTIRHNLRRTAQRLAQLG